MEPPGEELIWAEKERDTKCERVVLMLDKLIPCSLQDPFNFLLLFKPSEWLKFIETQKSRKKFSSNR